MTIWVAQGQERLMAGSNWERVYKMAFAAVYPQYVRKAEAKGRSKAEVDEVIRWLTGYPQDALEAEILAKTDFRTFFEQPPAPNPARSLITGTICGYRVEEQGGGGRGHPLADRLSAR